MVKQKIKMMNLICLGKKSNPVEEQKNSNFVEFLQIIFSEEKIRSLKDLNTMLQSSYTKGVEMERREVDYRMEMEERCNRMEEVEKFSEANEANQGSESVSRQRAQSTQEDHNGINVHRERRSSDGLEEDKTEEHSSYLFKSKELGKIGPLESQVNRKVLYGNAQIKGIYLHT